MSDRHVAVRACGSGEDGLSILETILALSLFALVIVGVAASAGAGLRLTGQSNSRQEATQVAVKAIELLRAADYSSLGMPTGTVYETAVVGSPDQDVTSTNEYAVPLANPVTEPLVAGTTLPGGHKPPVVALGSRRFQPYQYVTRPSGSQNRKRLTVVVTYKNTGAAGGTSRIVFSSLIGPGSIGFPSSTTSSSTSSSTTSSTTTSSTTTSTTAPPTCTDTSAPAGTRAEIASGTGTDGVDYVNSTSVQLKTFATHSCGPVRVEFSNDGATFASLTTITGNPTVVNWSLAPGVDGVRTVTFRFISASSSTTTQTDQATLDTQEPTTPTGFAGTSTKNSSKYDVALSWLNNSSDGAGAVASYEVFRKAGSSGSFASVGSVIAGSGSGQCPSGASCAFAQNDLDGGTSYSYYVVALDRAGNPAMPTATRTCARDNSNTAVACS